MIKPQVGRETTKSNRPRKGGGCLGRTQLAESDIWVCPKMGYKMGYTVPMDTIFPNQLDWSGNFSMDAPDPSLELLCGGKSWVFRRGNKLMGCTPLDCSKCLFGNDKSILVMDSSTAIIQSPLWGRDTPPRKKRGAQLQDHKGVLGLRVSFGTVEQMKQVIQAMEEPLGCDLWGPALHGKNPKMDDLRVPPFQETSTFSHQGPQGSGTVCSVPLLTWPRLLWRTTLSGWNRPVRFSWPGSGVRNGKELTFVKQRTFVGVSMMAWSTRTMSNLDQQTLVDQLSVRHRTIHLTRACQLLWPALVVHCVAWHISTGYVQENVGEALRTQLWQCPQNFWIAPFWYTKHIHLPRTWGSSIPTWWFMMVYFRCQSNSIGSNQVFWTSPNLFSRSGSAHCSEQEKGGERAAGLGEHVFGCGYVWISPLILGRWNNPAFLQRWKWNEMNTSFSSNKSFSNGWFSLATFSLTKGYTPSCQVYTCRSAWWLPLWTRGMPSSDEGRTWLLHTTQNLDFE